MGVAENEIDLDRLLQDMPEVADLLEAQDDAPVIRMINALFAQARDGASDIHIEPFETHSVVRYRVDGRRAGTCRADLAHQDHGPPGHRREAPARTAASRCAWAIDGRPPCRPATASAPCCVGRSRPEARTPGMARRERLA